MFPVTVVVKDYNGIPQSGWNVNAFLGAADSGYSGITDENGQALMSLPQGEYRFRADKDGTQYWSDSANTCTIPGCTTATVTLPAQDVAVTKTITYTYDLLNRLTAADYSSGEYFHYTYDNAGNRLAEDKKTTPTGAAQTTNYAYDNANRMTYVNGVFYAWDANGNMLSDGTSTYVYDHANRLVSITSGSNSTTFTYNGDGDQLTEMTNDIATIFTVDLNSGLTQVISDGTNTYLFGVDRISQTSATTGTNYFLGDALGSVRQLADGQGKETLALWYEPYGDVLVSVGSAKSIYGYTGEMQNSYIKLIDLRSRWYDPATAMFTSHDTWPGDSTRPQSLNAWDYAEGNPILLTDHSGNRPVCDERGQPPDNSGTWVWNPNTCEYQKIKSTSSSNSFGGRQNAIEYAKNYSLIKHDWGNGFILENNLNYYVYANLDPNYTGGDCANFASQVLWSGGIRLQNDDFNPEWSIYGHINLKYDKNSDELNNLKNYKGKIQLDMHNWVRAEALYDMITTYSNHMYSSFLIYQFPSVKNQDYIRIMNDERSSIMPGDLVFYKYGGTARSQFEWDHVAIIVDWKNMGFNYLKYTQDPNNPSGFDATAAPDECPVPNVLVPYVVEHTSPASINRKLPRSIFNTAYEQLEGAGLESVAIVHIRYPGE